MDLLCSVLLCSVDCCGGGSRGHGSHAPPEHGDHASGKGARCPPKSSPAATLGSLRGVAGAADGL
eukprot:scaffold274991_cov16-Tisochrysis_lutea.AAC.2